MASGLSHVDESPELIAISKNLSNLCQGVIYVSNLTAFAMKLEERGFLAINARNGILSIKGISEEEKCSRLLGSAQEQIRMDPAKFDSFIDIFKREPALTPYGDILTATHSKEHSQYCTNLCVVLSPTVIYRVVHIVIEPTNNPLKCTFKKYGS